MVLDFNKMLGAEDLPDDRDIRADELFMDQVPVEYPVDFIMDKTPILNQGRIGACTAFGSSGAWFEQLAQIMHDIGEPYVQPFDVWWLWEKAKERGASDSSGWYIQSMLQLMTDLGLIGGYVRIGDNGKADEDTFKSWLYQKYPIVTGCRRADWRKVSATGFYITGGKGGHCYNFHGWKTIQGFFPHCPNSWNGVGAFFMDFKKYSSNLFTQYIIIPTSEVGILKDTKDKRREHYLDNAENAKLWNKSRPNDIATPYEISEMVDRALKTTKKSRKWYAKKFSDNIIQGKSKMEIWNLLEGLRQPTLEEKAIMFTRAVLRDPKATKLTLTREQVVIVCSRDLLK